MEPTLCYGLPERVEAEIADAATLPEIERAASQFLNDIGFKQYTYHLERCEPHGGWLAAFFSNYDQRWLDRYIANGYLNHDLLHVSSRQSVLPFCWLPRNKKVIPQASARVFSEAQDFGIRDGVSVPIHGPSSFALFTAVADGTPREREETIQHAREAVTALGLHVHERAAAIIQASGDLGATDAARLTERERECLRWVAAGKTSGEIGEILGIAEGTVGQHIASVREKLGTTTRAHAAVRAMHLALIESA